MDGSVVKNAEVGTDGAWSGSLYTSRLLVTDTMRDRPIPLAAPLAPEAVVYLTGTLALDIACLSKGIDATT